MIDAENILVTHLNTYELGTTGTDLFEGPVRGADEDGAGTMPVNAVFVNVSPSSGPPERVSGHMSAMRFISMQIRVRNAVYNTGEANARSAYDIVSEAVPSSFADLWPEQSAPVFLGEDENGWYEWSINVTAVDVSTITVTAGEAGDGSLQFDTGDNSHHLWLLFELAD